MIHYLYKTINNLNGHYYYGIHSTNDINDGYLGSGKRFKSALKKYGKHNFTKHILEYFSTRRDAELREKEVITEEMIKSKNCYNLTWGGQKGQINNVPVKDINGNTFQVSKNDPRYLSGELKHILYCVNLNKVIVKDNDGNTLRVDKNDPRYLSGELVGVATGSGMTGKVQVFDREKHKLLINIDDPRYLSGELISINTGTIWIHKGSIEKMIYKEELSKYISSDWIKGRIRRYWVHNDTSSKMIYDFEIGEYIKNGWKSGRGSLKK